MRTRILHDFTFIDIDKIIYTDFALPNTSTVSSESTGSITVVGGAGAGGCDGVATVRLLRMFSKSCARPANSPWHLGQTLRRHVSDV